MRPMRHRFAIVAGIACCLAAGFDPRAAGAEADWKLAAVFGDHMVLERDRPVPIWGWAQPGEEVSVAFAGQSKTARADAAGKWQAKLDPLPASAESRDLIVESRARDKRSTITDVLVGDVWLCTGQSNMGMNVRGALNPEQEIAQAQYPAIRFFVVTPNPVFEPAVDVEGRWQVCSPQTAGDFSGVGYFFGRELHRELGIPIGLLRTSLGATHAEAWTSQDALRSLPFLRDRVAQERARGLSQEEDNRRFVVERAAWEAEHGVRPPTVSEEARGWAAPDLDTADWTVVAQPASWGRLGAKSGGVFWVRKDVTLPDAAAGKPFTLGLDKIEEQYDTAFFNGVEVGRTNDEAPDFYNAKRYYRVPGKLVHAGRNVVAVRVVAATPRGGMRSVGRPLELPPSHRSATDEPWLMKTEAVFSPLSAEAIAARPKPNNMPLRDVPSALFDGMVAPLMPFAVQGAIWYQGESNTPRPGEYRELLSVMIRDWRGRWAQGDFPFLIQQLVNNGPPATDPNVFQKWPLVREAQDQVAATVPNCGLAVGIELGSDKTIHPPNKQDVGRRLALVALEKVYGRRMESSGPRYASMAVEGNGIRVWFSHAEGLIAKDGPPRNFAVAGSDRKFVWADASIDGGTVVVRSSEVPEPVAVRYAWADNPAGCNLYNAAGLPAAPFRTDDWQ